MNNFGANKGTACTCRKSKVAVLFTATSITTWTEIALEE
jgi:hypothetical protein